MWLMFSCCGKLCARFRRRYASHHEVNSAIFDTTLHMCAFKIRFAPNWGEYNSVLEVVVKSVGKRRAPTGTRRYSRSWPTLPTRAVFAAQLRPEITGFTGQNRWTVRMYNAKCPTTLSLRPDSPVAFPCRLLISHRRGPNMSKSYLTLSDQCDCHAEFFGEIFRHLGHPDLDHSLSL